MTLPEQHVLHSDDATHTEAEASEQVPTATGAATSAADSSAPSGAAVPVQLGGYRLLESLGEGGMGMVYRAIDETLNRVVAVKVMRPEIAQGPNALERFLREARAAAAVKSDYIVTVYQVGYEQGLPFLAMEHLQGESLEARSRRERLLPIDDLARIGRDLARGLAAAHAQGLIHRDIKPANAWIEPTTENEFRAKLLDFGLARGAETDAHITGVGQIVGTPAYMSPEQANGDPVDGRSDLFSLGILLYRLATGILPFRGDGTMAVLTALATHEPRSPKELRPDLPDDMAELIHKLLRKNRNQRPATAAEVANHLSRRIASHTVIHIEPLDADVHNTNFEFDESDIPTASTAIMPSGKTSLPPRRTQRRRPGGRFVLPVAFVLCGLILLIGFWQIGVFLTEVKTARGTLIIEADDPNVEVIVKKDGATIKDKTKAREIELTVGDYTIELADDKGLRLSTRSFTIERDGKAYVKVRLEHPKFVAAKSESFVLPAVYVPPYDPSADSLDQLERAKIAPSEMADFLPQEVVAVLGSHKNSATAITASTVGNRVISLSPETNVIVAWRLQGPAPTSFSLKNAAVGTAFTSLPDGRIVGIKRGTSLLCAFDSSEPDGAVEEIARIEPTLKALACSRNGRWLATASENGIDRSPRLIDIGGRKPRVTSLGDYPAKGAPIERLQFSPGEQFLVAVGAAREGRSETWIWDLRGSRPQKIAQFTKVSSTDFALDSATLILGYSDGKIQLIDYGAGEFKAPATSVSAFDRRVQSAILLPGGKTLIASDDRGSVKFIDVASEKIEKAWTLPIAATLGLANDGRHVFFQNANKTCYIVRLASVPPPKPSPLDELVARKIPERDRLPGLPKEVVAIVGSPRGQMWWNGRADWKLTPDGKRLITVDAAGVHLIETATMREIAWLTTEDLPSTPLAVAVSVEGTRFVVSSLGLPAVVYVVDRKGDRLQVVRTIKGIPQNVNSLTVTNDFKRMALKWDGSIATQIWNLEDEKADKPILEFSPYTDEEKPNWLISFLPDGRHLLTHDLTSKLPDRIWDVGGAKAVKKAEITAPTYYNMPTFRSDSKELVYSFGDGWQIWDWTLETPKKIAEGKSEAIGEGVSSYFLPDGKVLFIHRTGVELWDARAKPTRLLERHHSLNVVGRLILMLTAEVSQDRSMLVGGVHGALFTWDLSTSPPKSLCAGDAQKAELVDFNRTGSSIRTRNYYANGPAVQQTDWNLEGSMPRSLSLDWPGERVSPDGKWAATSFADPDRQLSLYHRQGEKWSQPRLLPRPDLKAPEEILFSNTNRWVAAKSANRWVAWDLRDPNLKGHELLPANAYVGQAHFAANDQTMFIRTNRGMARIDLSRGKPQVEFLMQGEGNYLHTAPFAISPDGRWLSGDFGKGHQIISLTSREQDDRVTLDLPVSALRLSAFSPNGKLLATADGRLRLWDVATGKLVQDLGYLGPMRRLRFSPDGRHLITANANSTLYVVRLTERTH